ncbi:putative regulatory protein cys-3 protein [Eutypa lata UCREL1]|uniref:Putative regulatory protein cys-3 protein n=1 Tax=Eutypa lata (strain UCR-EL1) TaxID=1287681 RepID=M7TK88_EUTLA|nr:putative regulatory protein cys-3 protein [Eutypa lata UCREL1]
MAPGDYGFGFDPYTPSSVQPFSDNIGSLPPIQPSPTFPRNGAQQRPYGAPTPQTGDKRKATEVPPPRAMSFEEQSRLAAEEDKRRRNTAASARFRVKKKAREQALEKSQKELNDKVTTLETRIQTLETENKWLRELVMEKNGGSEKVVTALLQQKDRNAGKGPKAKDEITAKTS